MPELGLFLLGIVLLPGERVPLHVFEEPYKELIGECIALGEEFGLLYMDASGLREVGCRATVVEVLERFDDGRMNVLVEGAERFRIIRQTGGRTFSTAEVEPVDDTDPVGGPEPGARALNAFHSPRSCRSSSLGGSSSSRRRSRSCSSLAPRWSDSSASPNCSRPPRQRWHSPRRRASGPPATASSRRPADGARSSDAAPSLCV